MERTPAAAVKSQCRRPARARHPTLPLVSSNVDQCHLKPPPHVERGLPSITAAWSQQYSRLSRQQGDVRPKLWGSDRAKLALIHRISCCNPEVAATGAQDRSRSKASANRRPAERMQERCGQVVRLELVDVDQRELAHPAHARKSETALKCSQSARRTVSCMSVVAMAPGCRRVSGHLGDRMLAGGRSKVTTAMCLSARSTLMLWSSCHHHNRRHEVLRSARERLRWYR